MRENAVTARHGRRATPDVGRSARDGMLFAVKHAIHQPEETPEDQAKGRRVNPAVQGTSSSDVERRSRNR